MMLLAHIEYTMSEPQTFVDGHENNRIRAMRGTKVWFPVSVLKCLHKREKKYSEQCFYFVVKVKPTQGYFRIRDINRTKQ